MINIPVWMYLSSYVDFRARLLTSTTVSSLLYFGRGVFGSDFGTTAFVILNSYIKQYIGLYKKLFERKVEVEPLEVKERKFFDDDGVYVNKQDNFWKVSGNPYAYNMTPNMQRTFEVDVYKRQALQPHFSDVPILVMYPGEFDGRHVKLFNRLQPNDYYRAFNVV